MKNSSKQRFSTESVFMLLISIIIVILIISFLIAGEKVESFFVGLIGLFFWGIKILLSEQFKKIDRKAEQQNKILLKGIQAGYEFKQTVMQNMYDKTNDLWNRSIWIVMNWNRLWPGYDDNVELREEFNTKFSDYVIFMKSNSINIPTKIYTAANKLVEGIDTYKSGRMFRDENIDDETRREGSNDMKNGTRLIKSSMGELFRVIRKEFELERLPSDVLNIPDPDEQQNDAQEAE